MSIKLYPFSAPVKIAMHRSSSQSYPSIAPTLMSERFHKTIKNKNKLYVRKNCVNIENKNILKNSIWFLTFKSYKYFRSKKNIIQNFLCTA